MSFSMEAERQNQFSFLDIEVIPEQGKFTTTTYCKPTFSCVYSNSESLLPSACKIGMIYTLLYRYFRIYLELTFFKKKYFIKMAIPKTLMISVLKSL